MKKIIILTCLLLTSMAEMHSFCILEQNNARKSQDDESKNEEPKRRALPAPFASPPFPSAEYQGYPLIGVPPDDTVYPLMKEVYKTSWGEAIKKSRVKAYGWVNGSVNCSTCKHSNSPFSYWLVPNKVELDQFMIRVEGKLILCRRIMVI